MKTKFILLVGGATFPCVCTAIFSYAEIYELVADEDLPIRKIINLPYSAENSALVLKKGERLKVSRCVDYKSDVAVEVNVSGNEMGYVGEGDFHLEYSRWPFKVLFFDAESLVWSCGPMFNHRKQEIQSRHRANTQNANS